MEVLIVDGVPTKTHAEKLMQWTKLIFLLQLGYLTYRLTSVPNHWVHYMIGFIVCGIYIPMCGYKSAKKMNHRNLSLFIGTQSFFSFLALFDIVAVTVGLTVLQNACEQCYAQFTAKDECELADSNNESVVISIESCLNFPDSMEIAIYMFFMSCILFTGCWTIVVAQRALKEKYVVAHIVHVAPNVERQVPVFEGAVEEAVHVVDFEGAIEEAVHVVDFEGAVEEAVEEGSKGEMAEG
jgi:hypothetical protein